MDRPTSPAARTVTVTEPWAAVSPAELLRTVKRRLPSVVLTTVAVTLVIATVLVALPNQYASDGLFYVRLGRGAISADPTTLSAASVSLQESRASEVLSVSQMLASREIADRVVQAVGVRELNYPRTWVERAALQIQQWMPAPAAGRLQRETYDRQIAHEQAVRRVQEAVTIAVPKNGYTIAVSAHASDPLLAQSMVQAIMDQYGAYHVEAHRSTGSLDFFEQQTRESQKTALAARQALQRARNEMGWMSTESAEQSLRERILNLELSLDQAESALAESRQQSDTLLARMQSVPQWIPMEVTTVANNAADGMRTQLYEFKLQDGEKLSKVTPSHPRYKILRDKIDQGEEIINSEQTDFEQTREAINPIHLKLETDYQVAVAQTSGLQSRRDSLQKSLQAARAELQRLNEDAVRLAELSWAADIAEANYLSHAKSLEASRVTHELDRQQMSDVSVIQDASLNLKKVGPPRLALLLIGCLLGCCLGVLQAVVRDPPTVAIAAAAAPLRPRQQRPRFEFESYPETRASQEHLPHVEAGELVSSLPR